MSASIRAVLSMSGLSIELYQGPYDLGRLRLECHRPMEERRLLLNTIADLINRAAEEGGR